MIHIINIDNNTVELYCEESNTTVEKQLTDFIKYTNSEFNYSSLNITLGAYTQYFAMHISILQYQQLWQQYMNNVMSLSDTQSEATSRSIDTMNKNQDQLAREIIQSECTRNGTQFLLDVEGLSTPTVKMESVEVPALKRTRKIKKETEEPAKKTKKKK